MLCKCRLLVVTGTLRVKFVSAKLTLQNENGAFSAFNVEFVIDFPRFGTLITCLKWNTWNWIFIILIPHNLFITLLIPKPNKCLLNNNVVSKQKHVVYVLFMVIFSLPEPKTQVSYYDGNLSIVCRRCLGHCCRKLFTFPSSPPEPVGQYR